MIYIPHGKNNNNREIEAVRSIVAFSWLLYPVYSPPTVSQNLFYHLCLFIPLTWNIWNIFKFPPIPATPLPVFLLYNIKKKKS